MSCRGCGTDVEFGTVCRECAEDGVAREGSTTFKHIVPNLASALIAQDVVSRRDALIDAARDFCSAMDVDHPGWDSKERLANGPDCTDSDLAWSRLVLAMRKVE